jgi:hypothetical protein
LLGFSISHLRFAIQDAFFSILLKAEATAFRLEHGL